MRATVMYGAGDVRIENVAAADLELTPDDVHEIEAAQLTAEGARYPESAQRMIDR